MFRGGTSADLLLTVHVRLQRLGDQHRAVLLLVVLEDGDQRAPQSTSLWPLATEHYPRLVDPYDETADLNARARSYLHANCAVCHTNAGGGNSQINLEFDASNEAQNHVEFIH